MCSGIVEATKEDTMHVTLRTNSALKVEYIYSNMYLLAVGLNAYIKFIDIKT